MFQQSFSRVRVLGVALALTAFLTGASWSHAAAPVATATGCLVFVASNFNAPGDDNQAANLNGEWVRIKNNCTTSKSVGGWTIHDYNKIHTYKFPSTFSIGAGVSVTLYSGMGTNT